MILGDAVDEAIELQAAIQCGQGAVWVGWEKRDEIGVTTGGCYDRGLRPEALRNGVRWKGEDECGERGE